MHLVAVADELSGDADLIASLENASLKDVVDVEFAADLVQGFTGVAVNCNGIVPNDVDPTRTQLTDLTDGVMRQRVRQKIEIRSLVAVFENQNREKGPPRRLN